MLSINLTMKSPDYLGEDFLRKLKINLEQKISVNHELKDIQVEREINNINIRVRFSPPKQREVSINDLMYHENSDEEDTDENKEFQKQQEEYEHQKEITKQKIKDLVKESVIYTIKNYNKIIV